MRNHIIVFELLLLAGIRIASAQAISVGVKAGVPFTDAMIQSSDESRPYIVGPSVEIRLPAGFAIEADALYRRIGSSQSANFAVIEGAAGPFFSSFFNQVRGNSWEFPVIGKYYFRRSSAWQPFVGTGLELRTVSFRSDGSSTVVDQDGAVHHFSYHNHYHSSVGVGAVAAVGVRFHVGKLAISPEVRYTRWGNALDMLGANQAAFFLGLTY